MKAIRLISGVAILSLFLFNSSFGQKANYTSSGGLNLGVGLGGTYQRSDLANSAGTGLDISIGTPIWQKETAFISLDWKFRFLWGSNQAYDHRINPDNTYSNIQYNSFSYDLELGLTLNRLRERTGIVLSGFAGAGLSHGISASDLYDATNNLYDFSAIDPNQGSDLIYQDLKGLSDGDFETRLNNKASLIPTAGFFLGYQFSRSFTLGVEFKSNFYLTEQNSFTGIDLDNRILEASAMDRNNYISFGARWRIAGTRGSRSAAGQATPVPVSAAAPLVNITQPSTPSLRTQDHITTIKASVSGVSSSGDIQFYQSGFPNNSFSYNAGSSSFTADVRLQEGENQFRIRAANTSASAEDFVTIILVKPQAAQAPSEGLESNRQNTTITAPGSNIPLPSARFITPAYPAQVNRDRYEVVAEVANVSDRSQIILTHNGYAIQDYSIDPAGRISLVLRLGEGVNSLELRASNEAGYAADQARITYTPNEMAVVVAPTLNPPPASRPPVRTSPPANTTPPGTTAPPTTRPDTPGTGGNCPPPVIRVVNPASDMGSSSQPALRFRAEVRNVSNSRQLRLIHNGRSIPFQFSKQVVSASISLSRGSNSISLSAENDCGEVNSGSRITYDPAGVTPPCTPPTVTLAVNPIKETRATHMVRGICSGISNSSDISVNVNGKAISGIQFQASTGKYSAKLALAPGSYTIAVRVRNECGTDSKTRTFMIEGDQEVRPVPPVVPGQPGEPDPQEPDPQEPDPEDPEESEDNCGIRINPGNSSWQFCLVTPGGTYTRDQLSNPGFRYSGPASSLYFLPTAGGGTATVNGRPYQVRSGQYYLFTGKLQVNVSTQNPGSMGQWSVCITASKAPASGNGNKRPQSPCEEEKKNSDSKGNDGSKGNEGSRGNEGSKGNEVSNASVPNQGNEAVKVSNEATKTGYSRSSGSRSGSTRSTGSTGSTRVNPKEKSSSSSGTRRR